MFTQKKIIKKLKLFGYDFTWVVRHRWEKDANNVFGNYEAHKIKRGPSLGIWFKKNRAVGKKNFKDPKKWESNLVNSYMLGADLIVAKTWLNFSKGAMKLKMKKDNYG